METEPLGQAWFLPFRAACLGCITYIPSTIYCAFVGLFLFHLVGVLFLLISVLCVPKRSMVNTEVCNWEKKSM